jgi:hypothetical protein
LNSERNRTEIAATLVDVELENCIQLFIDHIQHRQEDIPTH